MTTTPEEPDQRWLLLQVQFPPGRSTARVGVWRRLRRLGAVALGGVWALPDDVENRESCEWLRRDVEAAGGEALLLAAQPLDRRAAAALDRRRRGEALPADGVEPAPLAPLDRARYQRRTWVTRPRPGVDRMASAWLLRRFVDSRAKFEFDDDPLGRGGRAVPFDAYGAELGHQQGLCTFEVLAVRFGIDEPAVRRLGQTVRAVDLHEARPDDAEAAMVARLVAGLRASLADDTALLEAGIALFEALYASPAGDSTGRRERPRKPERPGARPRRKRGVER
jgi:hypothetical protein